MLIEHQAHSSALSRNQLLQTHLSQEQESWHHLALQLLFAVSHPRLCFYRGFRVIPCSPSGISFPLSPAALCYSRVFSHASELRTPPGGGKIKVTFPILSFFKIECEQAAGQVQLTHTRSIPHPLPGLHFLGFGAGEQVLLALLF